MPRYQPPTVVNRLYLFIIWLCLGVMSEAIVKTLLLQTNGLEEMQGLKRMKVSMTPGEKIELMHLKKLIWKEYDSLDGIEVGSLELYDKRTGHFTILDSDDSVNSALSNLQGPTQLIVNMIPPPTQSAKSTLMIKGKAFDLSNGLRIAHHVIHIHSPGEAELGTGLTIWDGAIVLARYLEQFPSNVIGKRILEVGSGTGIVGIAAGVLGAQSVLLTDLPYTLENLQHNLDRNFPPSSPISLVLRVGELDWMDPITYPTKTQWDVIVGADVVWIESLIVPLVTTLAHLASSTTTVLIAHQVRHNSPYQ